MNEALGQLSAVLERRNYWAGPNLKELDSRSVDLLARHVNDIRLSGDSLYGEALTETDRRQAVSDCRASYYWDVITRRIIGMWADYTFGINISIVPQDPAAIEPWQEFFTANRNRSVLKVRNLYKLSDRLLTDGELFLLFFIARKGGLATIRTIPPEEVSDLVCAKSDQDVTYFYHRQWSDMDGMHDVYYRDWTVDAGDGESELPPDVQLAHEADSDTDVQVMHIAMNTLGQRGVPLMMPGIEWTRQYRDFLWDRAAVARAVATFVDEYKVKGGSRAVDAVKAALTSALTTSGQYFENNPPPVAGSSNVHNEAVDYKRQPLATGAGDAAQDASMFIAQAGLAGGIPPHLLGRGEAFRLATATAMGDPLRRQWTRQQGFWKDAWGDVVDLVLTAQEVYGGLKFASHECDVSIDPIPDETFLELSQALTPAVAGGFFDASVAKKMMMEAAGEKPQEEGAEQPDPPEDETPSEETPVDGVPSKVSESEVWAGLGQQVVDAARLLQEVAQGVTMESDNADGKTESTDSAAD